MPKYSERSQSRLMTCHPDLRKVMNEVIKVMDVSILEGHRNAAKQQEAFLAGKSKAQWPYSKHNKLPSMAVDVAPYPIDWDDRERSHSYRRCRENFGQQHQLSARQSQ